MDMCYDGALVMPSNYAVMSNDEMTYVEGGGAFSLEGALKYVGNLVLGNLVWWALKTAAKKVGAWAALNAAAIVSIGSRVVAIGILAGIAACYGAMIYKTYKVLVGKK